MPRESWLAVRGSACSPSLSPLHTLDRVMRDVMHNAFKGGDALSLRERCCTSD